MRLAVLSDIHSNCFALRAVIKEFSNYELDNIVILGDIFGYYPWANETYELLLPYLDQALVIKGNHDQLLLDKNAPVPEPSYWLAAKQNEDALQAKNPVALQWLRSLSYELSVMIDEIKFSMFHGTPSHTDDGRFYPDDDENHEWLPEKDEVILLGHTHYPLYKKTAAGGVIINPGSVGQPRDGDPMPSWGILDTLNLNLQIVRTGYDNFAVMDKLKKLQWEPRSIEALNKTNKGKLNF
jgi:putative phosphoesterase